MALPLLSRNICLLVGNECANRGGFLVACVRILDNYTRKDCQVSGLGTICNKSFNFLRGTIKPFFLFFVLGFFCWRDPKSIGHPSEGGLCVYYSSSPTVDMLDGKGMVTYDLNQVFPSSYHKVLHQLEDKSQMLWFVEGDN